MDKCSFLSAGIDLLVLPLSGGRVQLQLTAVLRNKVAAKQEALYFWFYLIH